MKLISMVTETMQQYSVPFFQHGGMFYTHFQVAAVTLHWWSILYADSNTA